MGLHNHVREGIKSALKAHDEPTLRAARNLLAAFTNELVAQRKKPQETLPDEDCLNVVRRLVKQRKDSARQFISGGREDLATKEEEELTYLQKYLPLMMSVEEIKKIAEAKKNDLGITDKSKINVFMGALMKELRGEADGGDVKKVVDELFS